MAWEDGPRLSSEMAAAQARLLEIRRALGVEPQSPREDQREDLTGLGRLPVGVKPSGEDLSGLEPDPPPAPVNWALRNAQAELARRRAQQGISTKRPSPLDAPVPVALSLHEISDTAPTDPPSSSHTPTATPQPPHANPYPRVFAAHPSLLMAVLRQKREAAGRVWLLLRLADADGRGWLAAEEVRASLTGDDSPLRVCGPRRLRQLLAEGDGLFWTRDTDGRLWLRGAAKVAAGLGVGRLRGAPVELPVAALTGGIQQTRAHFYAAFHSGRQPSPISRAALREQSGVPGRTQLVYEDVARVRMRPNLAVAERYSQEGHQQRAWERGRSVFRFVDHRGTLGKAGDDYLAWRLPNSYEGPHARRSRGGQKRLNRRLGDLVQKGIPGNDKQEASERLFWPSGGAAAKGFNRGPERDAFWPVGRGGSARHGLATCATREQVWSVIERQGGAKDGRRRGTGCQPVSSEQGVGRS